MGKRVHVDDKDTVAQAAQRLRNIWRDEYRRYHLRVYGISAEFEHINRWDGGTDKMGRTYKPIWPKIAAKLIAEGIDFNLAVKTVFGTCGPQPPQPTALGSANFLTKYISHQESLHDEIKTALTLQVSAAELGLFNQKMLLGCDDRTATIAMLSDLSVELSPLFRYCLAYSLNIEYAANQWRQYAVEQYLGAPDLYDKLWPCIPTNFGAESKAFRASAIAAFKNATAREKDEEKRSKEF